VVKSNSEPAVESHISHPTAPLSHVLGKKKIISCTNGLWKEEKKSDGICGQLFYFCFILFVKFNVIDFSN
jgi:hypothetical protein